MISQLRQLCALCLDEYLKLIFFFLLLDIFEVLYRPSWEHKSYFPGKVSLFFLPFLPSCLAIHYPQLLSFEGPVVPLIGLCGQDFKQLQNSLISSTWPSCPPWKILMYPSFKVCGTWIKPNVAATLQSTAKLLSSLSLALQIAQIGVRLKVKVSWHNISSSLNGPVDLKC